MPHAVDHRCAQSCCRSLVGCLLLLGMAASAGAADPSPPAAPPASAPAAKTSARRLGIVLYPNFELLDVCGPAEIFGNLGKQLEIVMVAAQAGPVASSQGPALVADHSLAECPKLDLVLVPGGFGTLPALNNKPLLDWLRERAGDAEIVMSVCSGSALLAKAGLLDGKRATSNKAYFQLAVAQGPKTEWLRQARWVDDGDRVTSSGVSAGIDMALAVVARLFGQEVAERIAEGTEYQWHRDADQDPFSYLAEPGARSAVAPVGP